MKPVVDGLANEAAGRYLVKVVDLSNADASTQQLADSLGIQYVPTFIFVNSDGTKANQIVGGTTRDELVNGIAKLK